MLEFFLISFFVGGFNVVMVSYIVEKYSNKLGALMYAVPTQFIITYTILLVSNTETNIFKELSFQSIISTLIIIGFLVLNKYLLRFFNIKKSFIISNIVLIILLGLQVLLAG